MSNYKLSLLERTLLCVTIAVISLSIILSLCIGLILPPNFIIKSIGNNSLSTYCICGEISRAIQLSCLAVPLEIHYETTTVNAYSTGPLQMHPYLVSLSINAYSDDDVEKRFACNGVIISFSWILAGQDCVLEHNEWYELEVRAGSIFWSTGGTTHKIKRILRFYKQGPVCLRVYPRFSFSKYTSPVHISKNMFWDVAYSPYWKDANNNKNQPFISETWTKDSCNGQYNNIGEIRNYILCNFTLNGKPLISNSTLIAYEIGICTKNKKTFNAFLNFQNTDYGNWISEVIMYGEPLNNGISIRSEEFVTYIYEMTEECKNSLITKPSLDHDLYTVTSKNTTEYSIATAYTIFWSMGNPSTFDSLPIQINITETFN